MAKPSRAGVLLKVRDMADCSNRSAVRRALYARHPAQERTIGANICDSTQR